MKKTWGEIRAEILALGAQTEDAYTRDRVGFTGAVNRAAGAVACFVKPAVRRLTLTLSEGDSIQVFDLRALIEAQQGRDCYMGCVKDSPVLFAATLTPPAFRLTSDGLISFMPGQSGEIYVYWRLLPEKITEATADTHELELDYEAAALVPLLAAFYIWADEDERKAVLFRNDYENMKNQLAAQEMKRPAATVNGAVGTDV